MDIESFPNYFLISFLRCSDNHVVSFDFSGDNTLDIPTIMGIIAKYEIITFNGWFYDIPILRLALQGASSQKLKMASNQLINEGMRVYDFEKEYQLPFFNIDYIDLIEVAPLDASLKLYMGRLHSKKLQDLPFDESINLTPPERDIVKQYCSNDLIGTKELFIALTPQIDLRRKMSEQYKVDLRSKSDAQIAEVVLKSEITKKTGVRQFKAPKVDSFVYKIPEFVRIAHEDIYDAIAEPFIVNKGTITMPKKLAALKLRFGNTVYQLGMGGLHSTEKSVNHVANETHLVCDIDVASYYPTIILNCGLYPSQMGPAFLEVYKELVEARLAGKRAKNMVIADSLRIAINGSFGKLGSCYSALYAPELLVQVTVTGQLCLLMLIQALEKSKIPVVSGNTDGLVIKCPRDKEDLMTWLIDDWQEQTGFTMERTDYCGIYSRDVNNYIAIKPDGKVKTKGCFSSGTLQKNPTNEICNIALIEYLKNKTPFADTIRNCKDITKFVTVRTVKGGAMYGSNYVGKVVRFYYSTNSRIGLHYKTSSNLVPRSQGAVPCQELPDQFPKDVDYTWYERECKSLLEDIGLRGPNGQQLLF